jgi:hypothetical protein
MSKKEQLDKEFAKLMNWRDKVFQLFLAMLTAEAIMIYAIISGEKPLYMLLLVVTGFVILTFVGLRIRTINDEIDKNIEETEVM